MWLKGFICCVNVYTPKLISLRVIGWQVLLDDCEVLITVGSLLLVTEAERMNELMLNGAQERLAVLNNASAGQ